MALSLTGNSGLSGLNFIPYLNPVTIEFDTTATTGQTFRPQFTRAVGNAPLQWTFPDANNTLGVATFSGNLPTGFTFSNAGTKTVSVSAPDWDSFTSLNCSECRLTGLRFVSSEIAKTLTSLRLDINQLTNITLPTSMPALTLLWLSSNQLTSLTLPATLTAVNNLQIQNNQLTSLALPTSMPALSQLQLQSNQLTSLTLPATLPAATNIQMQGNQLSSAQIINVFNVAVASEKKIASLNVSNNPGSAAGTAQQTILQAAPYAWTITR